jgi:hypothetical protein
MRSRPGDDFRSPVRETVTSTGATAAFDFHERFARSCCSCEKAFPLLFFRMDDSHGRFGHCFA